MSMKMFTYIVLLTTSLVNAAAADFATDDDAFDVEPFNLDSILSGNTTATTPTSSTMDLVSQRSPPESVLEPILVATPTLSHSILDENATAPATATTPTSSTMDLVAQPFPVVFEPILVATPTLLLDENIWGWVKVSAIQATVWSSCFFWSSVETSYANAVSIAVATPPVAMGCVVAAAVCGFCAVCYCTGSPSASLVTGPSCEKKRDHLDQDEQQESFLLLNDAVADNNHHHNKAQDEAPTGAENNNDGDNDDDDNRPESDAPSSEEAPVDDLYDIPAFRRFVRFDEEDQDKQKQHSQHSQHSRGGGAQLSSPSTAPPVLCRRSILRRTRTKTPQRDHKRHRPSPVEQEEAHLLSPTSSVEGSSNDDPIDLAFDDDY